MVSGVKTLRMILLALATVVALLCLAHPAWATPALPPGSKPVPGAILTRFDPPDVVWDAGHRGVDLAGGPGEVVSSAAAGTVTYAAVLAGRGVIVVDHGTVRTTYEPVLATVSVGEVVARGQQIGVLQAGHASCPGTTCLHWGLKEGDVYLDPLLLLGAEVRLLPASARPADPAELSPVPGLVGRSGLLRPAGPVTSPYGMRRHPLTGVWKLHDGTDFGAACGTPIVAAASGRVTFVGMTSGYGNRLVIDHGPSTQGPLQTSYNHAASFTVGLGAYVVQGQVIGRVGSTGSSTGCHLHFQVWLDGRLVDPMSVLT